MNCPTLSEELLASELFGHARGAFTGAVNDQPGRVEAAAGGTLFLDEIGELPPALQAKLLRFLQDRQFERVGEAQTRTADVRIVAATNRDLEADVAAGRFRQDLLFRLNTLELVVPPLRERREDIVPLARRFLALLRAPDAGSAPPRARPRGRRRPSSRYDWPGNIRELRNAMERAAILASGRASASSCCPSASPRSDARPHLGGDYTLDEIEREHIQRVLARAATADEAAQHPRHRHVDAVAPAQALRGRLTAVLLRLGRARQREPEDGAVAGLALDADAAAVRRHDLLADVQAEARAARRRVGRAVEALEQARQVLGRDARPAVAHLEADAVALGGGAHVDAAVRRRVTDRVGEEVRQHQSDAVGIGKHGPIDRGRPGFELDAGLARQLAMFVERVLDERHRRDVTPVQLDVPGLDARQVEQIVDDRLQPLAVVARGEQAGPPASR